MLSLFTFTSSTRQFIVNAMTIIIHHTFALSLQPKNLSFPQIVHTEGQQRLFAVPVELTQISLIFIREHLSRCGAAEIILIVFLLRLLNTLHGGVVLVGLKPISAANYWLGHLTYKNHPRNDLYSV